MNNENGKKACEPSDNMRPQMETMCAWQGKNTKTKLAYKYFAQVAFHSLQFFTRKILLETCMLALAASSKFLNQRLGDTHFTVNKI